jgi:hypothetical protein
MPYFISKVSLGSDQHVELSHEEYNAGIEARNALIHACYIEEKFAYLMDNYFELENDALRETLENLNHATLPFEERVQVIHLFNRRIINLLTTCRLYLDHVEHHLNVFAGLKSELNSIFTTSRRQFYDSSFAYRLLEALRNYVQHRGLPIKGISRNFTLIDSDNPNSPGNIRQFSDW